MIPINMKVPSLDLPLLTPKGNSSIQKQGDTGALFGEILANAKNVVRETIESENKTTELTNDFIMGKTENIQDLMIQQEQSNIMVQYTTQLRNNVIEAYQEIMRLPV